ncbi:mitochondrial rho GTPase 1-like protein, partial [Trifolium pratense]
SVELTGEAVEFLNGIFRLLDTDKDRALRPAEVDKLFCTAPESLSACGGKAAYISTLPRPRLTDLSIAREGMVARIDAGPMVAPTSLPRGLIQGLRHYEIALS